MCTISFVPTARGFRLAMNRDEKRTRVAALPPEIFAVSQRHAIYPREPSGGTWLAANDLGVCLALINWHRIEREPAGKIASRGRVIPSLIGASGVQQVAREIRELPLTKMRPFRLIVIDANKNALSEWRWDLRKLKPHRHRWQIQHWFSSGYDEAGAEEEREKVCANARFVRRSTALARIACLTRSRAGSLLDLYAPAGCGDGELFGSGRVAGPDHVSLPVWTALSGGRSRLDWLPRVQAIIRRNCSCKFHLSCTTKSVWNPSLDLSFSRLFSAPRVRDARVSTRLALSSNRSRRGPT